MRSHWREQRLWIGEDHVFPCPQRLKPSFFSQLSNLYGSFWVTTGIHVHRKKTKFHVLLSFSSQRPIATPTISPHQRIFIKRTFHVASTTPPILRTDVLCSQHRAPS